MPGAVQRSAVLVMAPDVDDRLEERLGPVAGAALRALLLGRAVAWAQAVAGEAVLLAEPGESVVGAAERAFTADRQRPLLIAWPELPRWRPDHASAALEDLAAGCALSVGPVFDGGFYLLALGRRLPAVLALPRGADTIGLAITAARQAGVEVGLLRPERGLRSIPDVAAALADPLLDVELRQLLVASSS